MIINNNSNRELLWTADVQPAQMADALAAFQQAYPTFATTHQLDALRTSDYARLDRQKQIYLDYTGGGLYAESQLRSHMAILSNHVFGNPHSQNPTSLAMTALVEQARAYVLHYFRASPDEYDVIFTANASGALKLLGEAYPFALGGHYLLTFDNHNSVNGIREFARAKGATVTYLPIRRAEMRLDADQVRDLLRRAPTSKPKLFAYPAQSNFTGVQHGLEWVEEAQNHGWDVLVDCASFVPTNRLDLSRWRPDFVPLSFYKIFGYPTGIGCLLVRKAALSKLRRPWFAGGTITITSVQGEGWHFLNEGAAGFEDGTVNYLNFPAVEIGLKHIEVIGIETIHERVLALTGWLLDQLAALQHSNGAPLVHIYGPQNLHNRGGVIAFNLHDPTGRRFDYRSVEALANQANISLRTGCFCNPGAGEIAHDLPKAEMARYFSGLPLSFSQFFDLAQQHGKAPSTIRISVGLASNFADVFQFISFLHQFLDKTYPELAAIGIRPSSGAVTPDTA